MKKNKKSPKWFVFIIPVNILLILYFVMTFYYNDTFSIGTWINGVYCTGKNVEEVNALLKEQTVFPKVKVIDLDGNEELLTLQSIHWQVDYTSNLQNILQKQNPFLWIKGIGISQGIQVEPYITYNETALQEQINKLTIVKEAKKIEPPKVEIYKTADGYELCQNLSMTPDADKIIQTLKTEIMAGSREIQLTEECYVDRVPTENMQKTFALWEKVEHLQDCGIVYDMGEEQIPINSSVVAEWIATDQNGNILTDEQGDVLLKEDCFTSFIAALAEEYDTYNVPREFKSTRGDVITIEKGTYGNRLDQKAEVNYLEVAFFNKTCEVHTPVYSHEALYKGKNDIGDTYIEVDMTEQMMYYYEDGEISIETPIVSGNVSAGHKTPARVCFVYSKQKNRILRGPDYASPVDFWMPVNGDIGIHDATWRSNFGGEIYKTNGSHGCINTPYEAMKVLYDKTEIGTPVIMFY